jgi:hypothetical protein
MGNVVAVLTVVGPTSLFTPIENGPAARRLLAASRAVSWRMGYEPCPIRSGNPERFRSLIADIRRRELWMKMTLFGTVATE